jgi:hypothetical protein
MNSMGPSSATDDASMPRRRPICEIPGFQRLRAGARFAGKSVGQGSLLSADTDFICRNKGLCHRERQMEANSSRLQPWRY